MTLLADLDAFFTDHRRCGHLDAGVGGAAAPAGGCSPAGRGAHRRDHHATFARTCS
jgi:hypothetical protein